MSYAILHHRQLHRMLRRIPATSRSIPYRNSTSSRNGELWLVVLRSLSTNSNSELPPSSPSPVNDGIQHQSSPSIVKAYMELSKARLSSLVVATAAAGFIAGGGPICPATLGACCIGTALCSSSASAWNQIFEVDRDARMKRTHKRPLVKGIISKKEATIAATTFGLTGTSILAIGTDPITTMLGASNIALYAGLYTYMKPRSIYNTWVGAIVGAIPPVMGWTASGGNILDIEAVLLGSTLFLWQMPHFFALSYMHRIDYNRGGFAMVSGTEEDKNGDETARLITRYTAYMSTIPFVATLSGVTSSMFAFEGIVLNSYALYVAKKFNDDRSNANARKVFLTSLWYLPSLLMLFLLHSKTWDDTEKDKLDDEWRTYLSSYVHSIRDKGRQICIHENAILQNEATATTSSNDRIKSNTGENLCPVSLVRKQSQNSIKAIAEATTAVAASSSLNETNK